MFEQLIADYADHTGDADCLVLLEEELTAQIIEAFFAVYRALGFGFLESPYANALAVELEKRGIAVAREVLIEVVYQGVVVGKYRLDLVVAGRVLVEVKATKAITEGDERQLLNYLKASKLDVGLLLHFGPVPEISQTGLFNIPPPERRLSRPRFPCRPRRPR